MPATTRAVLKLVGLAAVAGAAGGTAYWFQQQQTAKDRQIEAQSREIAYLNDVAARLVLEERAARIIVTRQGRDSQGVLETDLLFFDVDADGREMPARAFRVRGERVHVSALVIRFDVEDVKAGDPLRGRTVAFWHTIHGSAETPEEGRQIDPQNDPPRVYAGDPAVRGLDAERARFEATLWADFWRMASDTTFARERGARVAFGQDVFGVFEPDKVYQITLQSNGGLSLYSEPMPPILRESLRAVRPGDAP